MDSFRGLVEMDREIFLAKFDLASLGRILLVDFNNKYLNFKKILPGGWLAKTGPPLAPINTISSLVLLNFSEISVVNKSSLVIVVVSAADTEI